MGKYLQIRVKAETYCSEDVEKGWPCLWALAWPEPYGAQTLPLPNLPRGVLELVQALDDQRRFSSWSSELVKGLGAGIGAAISFKEQLEQALADWNPREANILSDKLEDALAGLERDAKALDATRLVKKK